MKVGDLVKHARSQWGGPVASSRTGIVIEITQKKVARLNKDERIVSWGNIEPEPHAIVMWNDDAYPKELPTAELDVVHAC